MQIQNPFLSRDGVKMQVVIFRLLQRTGWKCELWYFYYIQTLAKDGVKMQAVIFLLHSDSCKGRGENASCDISATFRLLQRTGWKCKLWYFYYIQTLARDGVKMQVVIFLRHSDSFKGRVENASCDISATFILHGPGWDARCDIPTTFSILQRMGWKCKLWYLCYIQNLAKDGVKTPVVIFLLHADSCKSRGENASCDISATCRLVQKSGWKCQLWYFQPIQTCKGRGAPHPPPNSATERWPGDWRLVSRAAISKLKKCPGSPSLWGSPSECTYDAVAAVAERIDRLAIR